MDNLPINNYGLLYSPGECYSREEAIEIIKESFFNPLPVEEEEEENIQVCCPSYEGKYPKIPIVRIFSNVRKYRVSERLTETSTFVIFGKYGRNITMLT